VRRPNQKIILVTGKGGVGKTAVAAALAVAQAHDGRKVLLAELGEKSFLHHVFPGAGGTRPVAVTAGLDVVRWDPESCLREYMLHYLRVEKVVDLLFANRVTQSLIGAAPALRELALVGKITSGARGVGPDLPYDVLVVDAFATGHFKALMMAPVGMAEVVRFGPMGEQSRSIVEVCQDPKQTTVVIVTLPEELPVNESTELGDFLKTKFAIEPLVVVNRNLALPLSTAEIEGVRIRLKALSKPPDWASAMLEYLEAQGHRQDSAATRIRQWAKVVMDLPWYFEAKWPDILRAMSQDLGEQWPAG
jgi:anion-transporting  ArsA/GET3 family ATPase